MPDVFLPKKGEYFFVFCEHILCEIAYFVAVFLCGDELIFSKVVQMIVQCTARDIAFSF